MGRRTEITVERRRVVVVAGRRAATVAWCPACGGTTSQVNAEAAALLCAVSTRAVYRAIEDGSIHWRENEEGVLWLCAESLRMKGWRE